MSDNFFDTCALKHRYVDTAYSRRVRVLLGRATSTSKISELTMVEMPSTLASISRDKHWSIKRFDRLYQQFLDDVASGIVEVRPSGLREMRRAIHLIRFAGVARGRALRTGDTLIASCALEYALETQCVINFYTADWALFSTLRDLNAFRTTMNLFFIGVPKAGSAARAFRRATSS